MSYALHAFEVSPEHLGWPVRRTRRYTVGVLRRGWFFTGDVTRFLQIFGMSPTLLGSAPEGDVACWLQEAAAKKHKVSADGHIDARALLTPAQKRRLKNTEEKMRGLEVHSWVCDVQQEVDWTKTNDFVPVLLRGSLLWSNTKERLALASEHLLFQGVPCFRKLDDKVAPCNWPQIMCVSKQMGFSEHCWKSMAGNAMHRAVAGLLGAYVIANLRRKVKPHPASGLSLGSFLVPEPKPPTDVRGGGERGEEAQERADI
ncbi:unnamed protein product, partial [Effrenium voratum]